MLPDVALLAIFDFCVDERGLSWHALVHVCRIWRNVVFGSPRRLGLKLYYNTIKPVRKTLDVWPPLPTIIKSDHCRCIDNIIPALGHNDRICHLELLAITKSQWKKILKAMRRPFPTLTYLRLLLNGTVSAPIPASFLGKFAPRLQTLDLEGISFPGLPKLLLSATHLVTLSLRQIPASGYILPEALVNCLSLLTRLDRLDFEFEYSFPELDDTYPPPRTRTLLPVLTRLRLQGTSEYLEDFVARIDAPLLDHLIINVLDELLSDTPQITQFIGRAPNFKASDDAQIIFANAGASVVLLKGLIRLQLRILCDAWIYEQLSFLVQACRSSFPQALLATLKRLYLLADPEWDGQPDDNIEIIQWLDLLRPFTGLKDFYMHSEFDPYIPLALQELVGERVTEVLPALRIIFWDLGIPEKDDDDDDDEEEEEEDDDDDEPLPSVQDLIGRFVAARQLADYSVSFYPWNGRYVDYY